MAFVGIGLAIVILAVAVLVVGSVAAMSASGGAALVIGLASALLACVVLPLLLERKLTRALRRLEPQAKSMLFQTLAIVNGVWLTLLLLLAPRLSRSALEQRGPALLPGHSTTLQNWLLGAARLIPRSAGTTLGPRPAPSVVAVPAPAKPSAAVAPAAPSALAPPAPPVIREAPEASEDTPASKVYRERASSVVVIHTRTAVPTTGPLAQIYEMIGASVSEGLGSGFVVEKAGLIVTNHHVIDEVTSLQVVTKEGAHFDEVSVLVDDARNDLALLSVPASDLPSAPLSSNKNVAIGARAIAIGCPLGFEYTLTEGIVSAHRNIEGTRFLQMQTGIAPGSSGGPLFDQHGAVIGVNTASSGGSLNLAVDVAEVKKLLERPRSAKVLQRFDQGPRMTSLEAEGADLDPTTRMNLRQIGDLIAKLAQKCVKPLPAGAAYTVYLPKTLTGAPRSESNLEKPAEECLNQGLALLGFQLSVMFGEQKNPPTALHLTIADLPRADGTRGELMVHFKL